MEKMNIRKIVLMFADAFIVFVSGALTSFVLSFFWLNPMYDSSRKSLIIYLLLNVISFGDTLTQKTIFPLQ